jgi:soluble lytic murein transglycosylase
MVASNNFGVDAFLIAAIMRKESTFNYQSTSSCGAVGLMQVMWSVHSSNIRSAFKNIRTRENMYEPYNNIMVGTWLYHWKFKTFKCHRKALQSYLGGSSSSYVNTVLKYQSQMYAMLKDNRDEM